MFTEMWGPRQPTWALFPELMQYMARNQFIIQTGTAKVDLAMYSHKSPWTLSVGFRNDNLQEAGFTYDYLGSASLESDLAFARGGVLAPDGPAYKALIFSNQTSITPRAATKVWQLARDGLPIFFVGDTQIRGRGMNMTEAEQVERTMQKIMTANFTNVVNVPSADDLVPALRDSGIYPNVALPGDGSGRGWYSFWRSTDEAELVWLYNDGEVSTKESIDVTFSGVAGTTPIVLDAWSGNTSSLVSYIPSDTNTTVDVSLAGNQTMIIAFTKDMMTGYGDSLPNVRSVSGSVVDLVHRLDGGKEHISALLSCGSAVISLSNNETLSFDATPPPDTPIDLWDIEIESWKRPEERYDLDTVFEVHRYPQTELAYWRDLDRDILASVSGVGRYSAHFASPCEHTDQKLGARLHLGEIRNSARIWLNGVLLPSVVHQSNNQSVIDVTDHVKWSCGALPVENLLEVEVSTTLLNRVQADANETVSMGSSAGDPRGAGTRYEMIPPSNYGLMGPVWVEWVEIVDLV